ncbi:MAG: asparagine synthase, partial [Armatimonadetes bacterium]|nr:asparagine synthase [Armatimonadota bacterium]
QGCYRLRRGDGPSYCADPRALRRLPGASLAPDPAALHGYLCFSHVPAPLSAFAGIHACPGGAEFSWQEGLPEGSGETERTAELRDLLEQAVVRRLGPEREVAVFLSGGLDSSLIAALLVRLGIRTHLFTLDFGPPWNQELEYAQQVARHLERPLQVVPTGAREIRGAIEATARALFQPFGDGVTVPLYLLGQAAAATCGVVFNGEGGDQLFGGWANKPMVAAELYGAEGYSREAAYLETYHRFLGQTDRLYAPWFRRQAAELDPGVWLRPALEAPGFRTLLHRLRAANLRLKGAQNIAPRCVQLAAAHSLAVRAPFFDEKLAEWSFRLGPEWFLQGSCEKYLLKRAAEPWLPEAVVWREKRGMGVPIAEWCSGPLRRVIAGRFSSRKLRRQGWLEPHGVRELLRAATDPAEFRRRRWGEKVWCLFLGQVWVDVQDPPLDWAAVGESEAAEKARGRKRGRA